VSNQTAGLYHLQTLDSKRDAARARLAEIDRLLGENQAVRAAQSALDEAKAHHLKWQTRAADLDLERARLRDEAAEAQERLYSGRVQNPRELEDLQHKIEELGHRRDALEEPLLEAMLEAEAGEEAIQTSQARLDQVLAEQAEVLGALTAEQDRLRPNLDRLEAEIRKSREAIEARYLEMYDELRNRPGGVAVSLIEEEVCTRCGVEITSRQAQQVHRGEVLPCPTCGRILVIR
jgi:predicted  nucleic acid-binding Zn-ribbon protein